MHTKISCRSNNPLAQIGFNSRPWLWVILGSSLLLAALPVGAAPFAYAAKNNSDSSSVLVIDTATTPDTVVDTVPVNDSVVAVAVAPDNKRVYVTNSTG